MFVWGISANAVNRMKGNRNVYQRLGGTLQALSIGKWNMEQGKVI